MKSIEELQEDEYRRAIIRQRINNLAHNWDKAMTNSKKIRKRII